MKKFLKKILLGILFIVVVTHRHEDYCRKHKHQIRDGSEQTPFTFGASRVKASLNNSTPEEFILSLNNPSDNSDNTDK